VLIKFDIHRCDHKSIDIVYEKGAMMFGIDAWLEQWLHGSTAVGMVLLMSLALGLRHAGDLDHLAAITMLIATERGKRAVHKAALMGLSWGLGHATTLMLLGLPILLLNRYLPHSVQQVFEVAIGGLIVVLALRLLVRWRLGSTEDHVHVQTSEEQHHVHAQCRHRPTSSIRTPFSAYGVGLLHGAGGTAGLTLLLLASIPNRVEAVVALLIFSLGTAVSMAMLSTGFGLIITTGPIARQFDRLVPVLGVFSCAFGVFYILEALG
jgi:cytochrome c biogenesis protein CcdA